VTRLVLVLAVLHATPARGDGAPVEAAIVLAPAAEIPAIAARLEGQAFHAGDGVIVIDDIARAGRPWTGVVERRGPALWLVTALGAFELTGPLARPRIAGPGYTIWVVGRREGSRLAATRIGVLRRPPR
jgi:hypothetical protein